MIHSLLPARRSLAGLATAISFAFAPIATAADCLTIVNDFQFCPDGSSWAGVRPRPEFKGDTLNVVSFFGQVVLVFSKIPQDQADELPRRPAQQDIAALIDDFSETTAYLGDTELERFAPLGEEATAASLATYDPNDNWVNIYTYLAIGGATLVVQTGEKGPGLTTLTDTHRAWHLEALRAVQGPEG